VRPLGAADGRPAAELRFGHEFGSKAFSFPAASAAATLADRGKLLNLISQQ
jgi:hypothetical protein